MLYEAQNIDTKKAMEHLRDMYHWTSEKETLEVSKIQQYYEGYRKGLGVAMEMFSCKNYEKDFENERKEDE